MNANQGLKKLTNHRVHQNVETSMNVSLVLSRAGEMLAVLTLMALINAFVLKGSLVIQRKDANLHVRESFVVLMHLVKLKEMKLLVSVMPGTLMILVIFHRVALISTNVILDLMDSAVKEQYVLTRLVVINVNVHLAILEIRLPFVNQHLMYVQPLNVVHQQFAVFLVNDLNVSVHPNLLKVTPMISIKVVILQFVLTTLTVPRMSYVN